MALSDLLLNKTSTPGLWFVKSRNISEDISQIIYDLAVSGALFLEIYTSDKERIVNSVISRITQDLKRNASSPNERLWIEDDLSYYYEYGTFSLWWENELNDYLPGGVFGEGQVWIHDYDSLFIENSERETILLDDINTLNTLNYVTMEGALQHAARRALQEKKSVFVFVYDNPYNLTNEFIRNRLISM